MHLSDVTRRDSLLDRNDLQCLNSFMLKGVGHLLKIGIRKPAEGLMDPIRRMVSLGLST